MSRPAPPELERTLCIVKPSAYAKRASIESTLVAHEFSVVAKQERTLTRAQATRLYLAHFGMPHFEGLIASMISGPVCVLLLARIGAVAELRHLVGPTDPVMARQVDATCLRAVYGGSTLLENGIHASKSLAEAAREEDVCFLRNKRTLILFGPPASGKGTQAELLIQSYGLVHISTGDLLRAHVKDGTPLGRTIKQFLEAGQLVPDELVTELTLERLAQPDCESQGWILDGFRTRHIQRSEQPNHARSLHRQSLTRLLFVVAVCACFSAHSRASSVSDRRRFERQQVHRDSRRPRRARRARVRPSVRPQDWRHLSCAIQPASIGPRGGALRDSRG